MLAVWGKEWGVEGQGCAVYAQRGEQVHHSRNCFCVSTGCEGVAWSAQNSHRKERGLDSTSLVNMLLAKKLHTG